MERQIDQLVAGKYRLVRRLARGGMGSVWEAFHVDLQAAVALKFIRPDSDGGVRSLARFQREARVLAQLRSPHIVQVLDFGVDEQAPYIAMELLTGEDLALLLARRVTLPPALALPLILEAARGLMVAHDAGVIHRDIKPSNLFVVEGHGTSRIKLIDFGIAKLAGGDSSETTEGLVLGSPAFMSPEQARGADVSASADVWSLAAVAFRMLTGRAPIEGTSPSDTVVRICTESPPLVSTVRPELGNAFDEVFESAFHRDINERLVDLDVFASRMRDALSAHDPRAVLPEWGSELPSRGGPLGISQIAALRDADATRSVRAPAVSAGRAQGRDSETASISLARNAPTAQLGPGSPVVHRARWGWLMFALAVVLIGWGTSARRSSAQDVSTPAARISEIDGDLKRTVQLSNPGASAPVSTAPVFQPTQPSALPATSGVPASSAQPVFKRLPVATTTGPRSKVTKPSPAPVDPLAASPQHGEPRVPHRDPVFGLPVSEP